jgi:hypothetical protein
VQTVLEHALRQLDLPTRSEVNSLHRQIRELRLQLERTQRRDAPAPPPTGARASKKQRSKRPAKPALRSRARTTKAKARSR